MKCNLTQEQMTLTDRIAIETGICHKDSFQKIALFLHRHPTTISHEVKENRTFLPTSYFLGKSCYFVRECKEQHVCGDGECTMNYCRCRSFDCRTKCSRYRSTACHRFEKPPYVCNTCPDISYYTLHFLTPYDCSLMGASFSAPFFQRCLWYVVSNFIFPFARLRTVPVF